ncbi:MAG: OadG family protein [Firmicutes bacterium]|nr:OadG family protein [Bacillota bacterium]
MLNSSDLFVVVMGVGIVFLGLILLIAVCSIMSAVVRSATKGKQAEQPAVAEKASEAGDMPNRQQTVAAISAAIAENLGKDVSAIRILSIKKL